MKKIMFGSLVFLLIVFFVSTTSAVELNLDKTTICALLNYTGYQCDGFWCTNQLHGNFTTDNLCLINATETNQTNTTTVNSTINLTQVQVLLGFDNSSNMTVKQYIDNQTLTLRNSILDSDENRTRMILAQEYASGNYSQVYQQDSAPWPWYSWVLITVLVCGLVAFLTYNKTHTPPRQLQVKELSKGFETRKPRIVSKDEIEDPAEKKKPTPHPSSEPEGEPQQ